MRRRTLIAAGVAALLLLAGCSAGQASNAGSATGNSTIQVAGTGSADAEPNQAVLRVGVVATAPDAATARQRLAENTTRMRTALERIGVEDDQIVTQRYDIDRDRRERHERREGEQPRVQYRASHRFEITLNDTDRVGRVIDTAVRNGATEVDDIQFTLSTDRRRELEAEARQAAMADARAKARSLAADANLTVTGVKVIRTGGGAPRPVDETAAATPTVTAGGAASDVESGPVTVVTTVRVVYTAEPVDGGEPS